MPFKSDAYLYTIVYGTPVISSVVMSSVFPPEYYVQGDVEVGSGTASSLPLKIFSLHRVFESMSESY